MEDRSDVSTVEAFKCARCGNDFPRAQGTCDVCGFQCTEEVCKPIEMSTEDF